MENYSKMIVKAKNYIKSKDTDSDISVDAVAYHAGFSSDHFNRIFEKYTGFTIMEYVRFIRLRKASTELRSNSKSIIDIALDCGYDSHDSFGRAFKRQYGKTPSEYREAMKNAEIIPEDDTESRLCTQFTCEYPNLRLVNKDNAINCLLDKSDVNYKYEAICLRYTDGVCLYDEKYLDDSLVYIQERRDRYYVYIFSADYDIIANYCKLFSGIRYQIVIFTLDGERTILSELRKRGIYYESVDEHPEAMYRGEKYGITVPIESVTVRELTYSDYDIIENYYRKKECGLSEDRKNALTVRKEELRLRDVEMEEECSVLTFGVFCGDELIGVSSGWLQYVRGLVLNDCIMTSFLDEYATEEMYRYMFKLVTNAVLEKGAIPFDDIQCNFNPHRYGEFNKRFGNFNSVDMGYEIVQKECRLKGRSEV